MNSRRLLIRSPRRRGRASSDFQYPPRFWRGGPDDQVPLVPNAVPGNVGSYAASPNPSRIRLTLLKLLWIEVGRVYDDEAIAFDLPSVVFGACKVLDLTSIFVEDVETNLLG